MYRLLVPPAILTILTNYAWAVSSIDRLYELGVVTGTGGGRYSPQNSISRGDFMLMLDRAFDFADVSGTGFTDVPAGSYYATAIASAKALGIATRLCQRHVPTQCACDAAGRHGVPETGHGGRRMEHGQR